MKSADTNDYNFIRGLCSGDSCITINGSSELMVENHKGIIEVTSECIKFLTRKNRIIVSGSGLWIFNYNADDIVINGHICSIAFENRNVEK